MITQQEIYAIYKLNGQNDTYQLPLMKWNLMFHEKPDDLYQSVIDKGLMTIEEQNNHSLQSQTVTKLKELLKAQSLSTSGKKDELIQRILQNFQPEELADYQPTKVYELTPNGKETIDQENYVPLVGDHFEHGVIDFDVVEEAGYSKHVVNKVEYLNGLVRYAYNRAAYLKDYFQMDKALLTQVKLDKAFKKTPGERLQTILGEMYLKLSGLPDLLEHEDFHKVLNAIDLVSDPVFAKIPKATIDDITRLQKEVGWTDEQVVAEFENAAGQIELPDQLFSMAEMSMILRYSLPDNLDAIKKMYADKQKEYKAVSTTGPNQK
ncbi:SAP domain-containing protein [Lentilactobacillus diolivorans]|uniref:SAP domain-containing protein n=2 Tax=Lentilactobacillus diolivorans TaxID=179838 RepID=A0A0R1S3H5_9LACO|nr:SAP domain-containing protein [Lentilactobacillus diolivorans]KRL63193.1 hypothetical protein FC85_GL001615 [Lentilactobacillus diolivorans DSM 14421]GEP24442.1 hypothetical protein LDI01_20350 [Lentilactobacillus diolivorans]